MKIEKIIILFLWILIIPQKWGSYFDHYHYDYMYEGIYSYFISPIFNISIYFSKILGISSEIYWKIISLINAYLLTKFQFKFFKLTKFKSLENFTLVLLSLTISLPLSLFLIRAGLAISFLFIAFYSLEKKKFLKGIITAFIAPFIHLQVLIPALIIVFSYLDKSSISKFLKKLFKGRISIYILFSFLILICSVYIGFTNGYFINISERITFLINLFGIYYLGLIKFGIFEFVTGVFYLTLIIPYCINYLNPKSNNINLLSNLFPKPVFVLTIIPKILLSGVFGISRIFATFNFVYILAFVLQIHSIKPNGARIIYINIVRLGCLTILIRYLTFYKFALI